MNQQGTNIVGLLGIVFVVLKLTGVIAWSWWWVTLPFWGGFVIWLLTMLIIILFVILFVIRDNYRQKRRELKRRRREDFL